MADGSDDERRILTRKELAKEQRRAAYERAKAQRASDPRYLALKQAAKEQRRAAYQKLKQARKTEASAEKASVKQARVTALDEQREGELARNERTTQRAQQAAPPSRPPAATTESMPSGDPSAPLDAATITGCDAGLWQYVNWATRPKLTH